MDNIQRFKGLIATVNRKGVDKLVQFIEKSDFYTAPASTKYHLSCEGGLLQHSLNVYDMLKLKAEQEPFKSKLANVTPESIVIVSLLHDICKTYFYKKTTRNVKNEQTGQWEKIPYYTVEDKIPYGHGEKSVMMIEKYIELTNQERYAIRWHMGFTEPKENYSMLSAAMEKYPLLLALMEADLEASTLLEDKNGNKSEPPKQEMDFEKCN
ncbi:MAG: HD domain-containing protein [Ruminococcus sp.]